MHRLSIISDSEDRAKEIGRQLAGIFVTDSFARGDFSQVNPAKYTIVDIDLEHGADLPDLRLWLELRPKTGSVIFAVAHGVRRQVSQAYALGATDFVERPLDRGTMLKVLFGDIGYLVGNTPAVLPKNSNGVLAGIYALQSIFASVVSGTAVDLKTIDAAGDTVVSHIEGEGLLRWIDIVRQHHSQTYQHCLLVTGIAIGFGQHLGFSRGDRQKLALGGLLHDIGKAGIPVALLEKPGPLEAEEVSVMKQHPLLGFDALRGVQGLHPELLDVVVQHHEYLDGSGYPYRLKACQLSDLVRMITIADVFGALIERRAYKAPLSCNTAYQILESMGPKLDAVLVRQFQSVAQTPIR